ncbi:MAG: DedA family protein [Planctomycetes bacterium]|nr:DedA family protein [Planctomycetota bacterium]
MFFAYTDTLDRVLGVFTEFPYLAPFAFLFLCGLGLPSPEEVALIGSGILLHKGEVEFVKITLVCSSAILIGDSIPYWLGRRYGLGALKSKWIAKVLHPERFAALERRFAAHGNQAVFTCRFLPGLRIPGYFVAGTMKMSYWRFLLLDSLGVLVSVPASIYLGKLFGGQIDVLKDRVHDLHLWLFFAVIALVLIVLGRAWLKRRERAALGETPPPKP